jgi:non-homologous end joining protein Ku
MPRSIWNGTISFGLVNVPVKLHSALEPKTVRFREVHLRAGARIEHRRFCSVDGREVPSPEAEHLPPRGREVEDLVMELGVLTLLVVALANALYILGRRGDEP